MSDRVVASGNDEEQAEERRYERPRLTPIGNARDLLALKSGSIVDAGDPFDPTRGP
jgi:hypothetical protein